MPQERLPQWAPIMLTASLDAFVDLFCTIISFEILQPNEIPLLSIWTLTVN